MEMRNTANQEDKDESLLSLGDDDDIDQENGNQDDEGNNKGEPNPLEEVKALAEKETKRMRYWKWSVVTSLLVTGAVVSWGIYFFLENKQQDDFQNQFYAYAHSIADVTKVKVAAVDEGLQDLASEVTSYALVSNSTWPFVTMPNFEVNANHARRQTVTEVIMLNPLVTPENRAAYENYTVEHQGWINEARKLRLPDSVDQESRVYVDAPIVPFLFEADEVFKPSYASPARQMYGPIWQFSPAPFHPHLTNYDPLSRLSVQQVFERMSTTKGESHLGCSFFQILCSIWSVPLEASCSHRTTSPALPTQLR